MTTLGDFVKLADVIWTRAYNSVPQAMRNSGLVKIVNISANSGNTRNFSEIDVQEYGKLKTESDQAERAKVQQGLIIDLVKSFLINGENLKTAIKQFKATLSKQIINIIGQLQRLSERTLFISEATVRSA
uniref:Uncharacterized protein n=1 Tax=viral metagenome TaxID=1070528 RepID=A0A6M3KB70_9ZZZZ